MNSCWCYLFLCVASKGLETAASSGKACEHSGTNSGSANQNTQDIAHSSPDVHEMAAAVTGLIKGALSRPKYDFVSHYPPWVILREKPLRLLVCPGCDMTTLQMDLLFPKLWLIWGYY